MKKLIIIILAVCMIASIAAAEKIDLSGFSYDDLVKLQKDIVTEIMSRPEWKEVTVPAGAWRVGDDIPAGMYSIRSEESVLVCVWRKQIRDYDDNGLYYSEVIKKNAPCGKIILKTGMLLETGSEIIMSPPLSLGF